VGLFANIAEMQLQLFPFDQLGDLERVKVYGDIRRHYWYIRNLRTGVFGQARLRRHYRAVQAEKKRLLLAGVSKREILDLLACCRQQCTRHKHPFEPCIYCTPTR
jgi:plasmid stability protein